MNAVRNPRVADTDKTKNIEVALAGDLSLDDMESELAKVASELGLHVSHVTTLGRKRYPGNRHWHLKRNEGGTGCLDVTYWPTGSLMWISVRNYEPAWVHDAGRRLGPALEATLRGLGRDQRPVED